MDKKFVIWTIIATVIIMFFAVWASFNIGNQAEVAPSASAKAVTQNTNHDWGEIDIKGGLAEATFPIKNEGEGTLKLYNVTTSCACTSAKLSIGNTTSPNFGMHSKSSFVLEVPAGESATLTAVFDPLFHGPDAVGPITRQITVATNDPATPELSFSASADVIKNK